MYLSNIQQLKKTILTLILGVLPNVQQFLIIELNKLFKTFILYFLQNKFILLGPFSSIG